MRNTLPQVSFINSLCVTKDAISASLHDQVSWTRESGRFSPMLFCGNLEYTDLPAFSSHNYWDIARHEHFRQSDVAVFHFGVCYDAFNLLWLCPSRTKKVVVFHNITPPHLVSEHAKPVIERSFRQLATLNLVDLVICDSKTNASVLRRCGIRARTEVLPLALSRSSLEAPKQKNSSTDGILRLAFVGRFVRSKGPTDALKALNLALEHDPKLRVDFCMMGKLEWSDPGIIEEIHQLMAWLLFRWPERVTIRTLGDATENEKQQTLAAADCLLLPTYHEGFCVPILEAMQHGCRVITYDNSNTPAITGGLGRLVPTGDITALAQAIADEAQSVIHSRWHAATGAGSYSEYKQLAATHLAQFAEEKIKPRFLAILESQLGSGPRSQATTTET
jgi:glycosyltransferase involved in cell wall biosynthesis